MTTPNTLQEYWNLSDAEEGNLTEVTSDADTYNLSIHPVILSVVFVSISWILLANTIILICYYVNRKKVWSVFVAQILCLSLSDLFVGFAALPWIVVPILKPDSQIPYVLCSTKLYLLMSSQCGSLYHILAICAYRCIRIENATRINETTKPNRTPVYSAVTAWVIGFVICSLPFSLWSVTNQSKFKCVFHLVFSDKKKAFGFYTFMLIVPQMLTNILYVVTCLRLRTLWRRVFPDTSVAQSTTQDIVSNPVTTGYSRANFRIERRFMGTLGLIMALFNICTVPLLLLVFLEYNSHQLQRDIRYSGCMLFIMNSAVNPFVYALRSPWLKNALKRLYHSVCSC